MADIVLDDLTTGSLTGTGVFDKLMTSVSVQLTNEYDQGRIVSQDYSKVYLGAMEGVISQSIAFLLQEQVADKQADLIAAQIITEGLQGTLVSAQISKMTKETIR